MKNKLLYLAVQGIQEGSGVSYKILSQIDAFRHNGIDVSFSYLSEENGFLTKRLFNDEVIDDVSQKSYHTQKYGYKYRYTNLYNKILQEGINIIYIRYTHFANPLFIRFLSKLKRKKIKVFLEIPTFPYDEEYVNIKFKQNLFLKVERLSRQFFRYYCDKIVTVSSDEKIFGTDTIIISNGINIDEISIKKPKNKDTDIRLVGVANIRFWHGYDRVIKGLNDYYSNPNNKTKVYFDLIGDNQDSDSEMLRKLVKEYSLEKYVIFNGVIKMEHLDSFFDVADMAVGSLGIHRIGLKEASSIKSREYCAKGIPFIYSGIDRDFDGKSFVLKVADDDTNININSIVDFLNNTTFSAKDLRKYAEENLTWNTIIKKIIAHF